MFASSPALSLIPRIRLAGKFQSWLICSLLAWSSSAIQAQNAATVINISNSAKWSQVNRLGINLGTENYWDSGQMMKNLTFTNPGFEGETWQAILHCKAVTSTSCTDDNAWASWPANFFAGAQASFIYGAANGETATINGNTASDGSSNGVTISYANLPQSAAVGDYVVVRLNVPGNAQAGWWTSVSGGATLSTDFNDLSPETPGKQALSINASGSGQSATVSSYFDSTTNHSFLQLNGQYALAFRAKSVGSGGQMSVRVARTGTSEIFLSQTVNVGNGWQDYSISFSAAESGEVGTIAVSFGVAGSTILLDDVSLAPTISSAGHPTVFRDEVVSTLQTLKPGILRFMDPAVYGSSLDNLLQPDFARVRPGFNAWKTEADQIPVGLHDFLVLCQTVGADPWFTMPPGLTNQEMSNLIDYLGGSTTTVYGARRAALGQAAPWTSVFKTIHLELGDEVWNTVNSGATMLDGTGYGKHAAAVFGAARASSSYSASSFDLVIDGWFAVPSWTQQVLAAGSGYDSVDVAPYLFDTFNDTSSTEAIFGPMFAEPELMDSTAGGLMQQNAGVAASAPTPAKLSVYESNLSTIGGTATQSEVNQTVPSVGAGIVATEHMLLMMRDLGVLNQNMFALTGFSGPFSNSASASETSPLWGTVIDMGNTNLRRPSFLAEQLANAAILPTMLTVSQSGANPTWNQALSSNDNIALSNAHDIQSFAFTDGTTENVVLFNLSRTQTLPVSFSGAAALSGTVSIQTLTSANITDNNETIANVAIAANSQTLQPGQALSLPPFSMTVLSSAAISSGSPSSGSLSVSCLAASIAPSATTQCTAALNGAAPLGSSGVSWSASPGTVSANGAYTAPSVVPAAGTATITAVAAQGATSSVTISVAAPVTVPVAPKDPGLAFAPIPTATFGQPSFSIWPNTNSTGAITFSILSGPATISGSTITLTGVGTVTVQASQVAAKGYAAAVTTTSFNVTGTAPNLYFNPISAVSSSAPPFNVWPNTNSPGPISFSIVSGPATISGSTIALTGAGTVVVQASQAAAGGYSAATATTSFSVTGNTPNLYFNTIQKKTFGIPPFNIWPNTNSPGSISFSVVSGPATVVGSTVTLTGMGVVTIQASQAAAGQFAAATTTTSFTVGGNGGTDPQLVFGAIPTQTYGENPFNVWPFTNSPGAINFSILSGPAYVVGSTVTLTGTGTVTLQATQAAAQGYSTASTVTSFNVK